MYSENILKYWYAIEFSSPCYPFEKNKSIKNKLPWPKKETNKAIRSFFDVYIGEFNTQDLMSWMIQELKLNDEHKYEVRSSKCCLFALKVDSNGLYVENSFSITGLVWSICQLVKNHKVELDKDLFDKFRAKIVSKFLYNDTIQVDNSLLQTLYSEISTYLNIPRKKIFFTFFANEIRCQGFKKKGTDKEYFFYPINPQTEIMDSFYLSDIEKVIQNTPEKINHLIFGKRNQEVQIDTDTAKMKEWTNPQKYPLGLWPSSYSPCLMQQIAINLAISDEQQIFSVNGPPGTGKTTLLKEIIVSNIVDRAIAMLDYTYPDDAFEEKKFKNPPDQYNPTYYKLNEKLSQNGIVIASNNNFAVENLSLELPKEIEKGGRTGHFLNKTDTAQTYFSDIASRLIDKPAWGLISACLGNKKNINAFLSKFWFKDNTDASSDETTMQYYLKEAKNKQDRTACNLHIPVWEEAQKNFKTALEKVNELTEKNKAAATCVQQYEETEKKIKKENDIYKELDAKLSNIKTALLNLTEKQDNLSKEKIQKEKNIQMIKQEIPFFKRWLKVLFKSDKLVNKWIELENEIENILLQSIQIADQIHALEEQRNILNKEVQKQKSKVDELQSYLSILDVKKQSYQKIFGECLADKLFWKNLETNKTSQSLAPYTYKEYDDAREELFYQAMLLHKAFVLNSKRTAQNMYRLCNGLWNDKFSIENRREAYADLFNTFQLIVPVVSTTFASVHSFFDGIEANELGLLIIDEAGQATPQSALGAIWRSKKAVIVGDPLQVEPIVTIPRVLQTIYAEEFNIPAESRLPELSVQMLGDRINKYIGKRLVCGQETTLGCPLILHRRCIEPMFTISNEIAYDSKMINFTTEPNNITLTFNQSFWFNIQGTVKGKGDQNIEEQNKAAIKIFNDAMQKSKALPNLYIISPFKRIANTLRTLLEDCIKKQTPKLDDKGRYEWVAEHCGTIHTFQGKEANEVILVLGCDSKDGLRAAQWVGQKPNIINVAVSRAKYRLYVLGDYNLWKDINNVQVLCKKLQCIDSISKLNERKII